MYSITSKNDDVIGYLFGTLHVTKIDVTKVEKIKSILNKCSHFYPEITQEDSIKYKGKIKTNSTFSDVSENNDSVDLQLVRYFKSRNIPIKSLENDYTDETIDNMNDTFSKMDFTKLKSILPLIQGLWTRFMSSEPGENENPFKLFSQNPTLKTVCFSRDQDMAVNISKIISTKKRAPLFGIGCLHLSGVINNLNNLGYKSKKIPINLFEGFGIYENVPYKPLKIFEPTKEEKKLIIITAQDCQYSINCDLKKS